MDKLFLTILNMSLTGAFVIVAVILARLPLKKAPKVISYCLWAVAGFRLVFPFSIESIFSLLPFNAQTIPSDIATQAIPRIDSGIPYINNAVSSVLPAATPAVSVNPLQIWTAVGAYVWLIGAAAMLLYGVISYTLLKHRMRTAIRVEGNIYETDNIPSPFVLGIITPKIYLPLSLTFGEREYIILHEQTHIRRRDHIIKFAAYFILCLHWFNPLAWAAFLLMGVDMEMSCDERVLKEMGGDTKHDYSRSLLSLATQRRVIGGSPLAFGEGGVKERVKNVLNFKKPSRVIIVAAVALVAVLSVGFATNTQRNAEVRTLTIADFEKIAIGTNHSEVRSVLGRPIGLLSGFWGDIYELDDGSKVIIYYDDFGKVERINFGNPELITLPVNTVSIIVWKNSDNQTRYSLFDGDVTPAPSELSSGRVFNDTAELNAALAVYPQDTLSMVHVEHTMDFTKEEMISITEQFVIPSGNYSMPTGLYEFHITTLDEAREIVGEHYSGWPDITFVGEDTISYTNPPKPVEVYKFEVVVSGLVETCAVSKERGIFFNYSDGTWWAFTGLRDGIGATRKMTLDDVRAIAEKIGIDLTLGDLRDFISEDIGSGLQAMQYRIEDAPYMLVIGAGSGVPVIYANLIHTIPGGTNESIDIRYYNVDKFIADETKELVRPLPEPQETTPSHDPGYYTDLVQAASAEIENYSSHKIINFDIDSIKDDENVDLGGYVLQKGDTVQIDYENSESNISIYIFLKNRDVSSQSTRSKLLTGTPHVISQDGDYYFTFQIDASNGISTNIKGTIQLNYLTPQKVQDERIQFSDDEITPNENQTTGNVGTSENATIDNNKSLYDGMFDNNSTVLQYFSKNNYTADSYQADVGDGEASLKFANYSGSQIILGINFEQATTVGFSISADVKGEYKIAFITESNDVIMKASSYNGLPASKPIDVPKGKISIVFIGEQVTGTCNITLDY